VLSARLSFVHSSPSSSAAGNISAHVKM
jgi:hypothetical protein